jgi:hypothetical protein
MPRKSDDFVKVGHDDAEDFEEVDAADAPKDDAAKASNFDGKLGTPQVNALIQQTMQELDAIKGTIKDYESFAYYIIEKDNIKKVIFSVTCDTEAKESNAPDLAKAIAGFKEKEGKKADEITKFATVLIERNRQHIVFVSGDFKTHDVEVRDSRPGIFRKDESDLRDVLSKSGFRPPTYTTLAQQLSASQCGFYAYHYFKDYLYSGGRFAPYIHLLSTDQETYLNRYARQQLSFKDMKDIVCKHLEAYGGVTSRHRDRKQKVIKTVKSANTANDIREILIRQIDLFEGKKVESDAKKTQRFSAYFEKTPESKSLSEGFFSAVVSALAEIDGFKAMTTSALQVRDDLPNGEPKDARCRNRNSS